MAVRSLTSEEFEAQFPREKPAHFNILPTKPWMWQLVDGGGVRIASSSFDAEYASETEVHAALDVLFGGAVYADAPRVLNRMRSVR